MNLLDTYKLQKRLEKLESILHIINEDELTSSMIDSSETGETEIAAPTKAPRIKKNLFSKKLEEVKAAVEAGKDVNQTNAYGKTPLMALASSSSDQYSDIAEYLVKHNATVDEDIYKVACNKGNFKLATVLLKSNWHPNNSPMAICYDDGDNPSIRKGTKAPLEFFMAAAAKETKFDFHVHRAYERFASLSGFSRDQIQDILLNVINHCTELLGVNIDYVIRYLLNGDLTFYKAVVDKFDKVIPSPLSLVYNLSGFNNEVKSYLLELYRRLLNSGELKFQSGSDEIFKIDAISRLYEATGNSGDALDDLISSGIIKHLESGTIINLLRKYLEKGDINHINKLASTGVKVDLAIMTKDILRIGCNQAVTRSALRMAERSKSAPYNVFEAVAKSDNRYLIEYFVDLGYGERLSNSLYSLYYLSDTCREVLTENDIELPPFSHSRDIERKEKEKRELDTLEGAIITALSNDEIELYTIQAIEKNPEVLSRESVAQAIKQHSNTITGRQLQRLKDRLLPGSSKDTYDM